MSSDLVTSIVIKNFVLLQKKKHKNLQIHFLHEFNNTFGYDFCELLLKEREKNSKDANLFYTRLCVVVC